MISEKVKDLYSLEPDLINQNSLTDWYNRLLEKTLDEINIYDIGKMNRQDVLKNLAAKRAIDLFILNPFDGEVYSGDIIETVIQYSVGIATPEQLQSMKAVMERLEKRTITEDDLNLEDIPLYLHNLVVLKEQLNQRLGLKVSPLREG